MTPLVLIVGFAMAVSTGEARMKGLRILGNNLRPFKLEETYVWRREPFVARWLTDFEIVYRGSSKGKVMSLKVLSNESRTLFDSRVLEKYKAIEYQLSYDGKYALIKYRNDTKVDVRQPWLSRYKFVIYSLSSRSYHHLDKNSYIQHAEWVPRHRAVVYIKDNNIYRYALGRRRYHTITYGGKAGSIFNGVSEWMYREEVFKKTSTLTFSPDGKQLLYIKFDSRNVPLLKVHYQGHRAGSPDPYVEKREYRVATPGDALPIYEVWHFNFTSMSGKLVSSYKKGKEIMQSITWVSNHIVQLVRLNRIQNQSTVELCSVNTGSDENLCRQVGGDWNSKGWANTDRILFSRDGDRYIRRARNNTKEGQNYYLQIMHRNGSMSVLSTGKHMVTKIVAWDEKRRLVYFKAFCSDKLSSDHVYVVSELGNHAPYCKTCLMPAIDGSPCQDAIVSFNRAFTHLIATCLGPGPNITYAFRNVMPLKVPLRVLDDSSAMRQLLYRRIKPNIMNLKVKITDKMEADVRLLLPPFMDLSGKRRYPLLIGVNGEPGTDQVTDQFKFDWSLFLTTNRSIIYGVIDGRGSGRKGTEMMYAVYRALGTADVRDQITVTKYLRNKLPFIDSKRIGIWGRRYGGYMATKVLENDVEGVFKCGAAFAPITDLVNHNAIFSERYMDLPRRNEKGYRKSSTLFNVKNLRYKKFLLMYGTGDDWIYHQHSEKLAKVLKRNAIVYDKEAYQDLAQSSRNEMYNLYLRMSRFFAKCFRRT